MCDLADCNDSLRPFAFWRPYSNNLIRNQMLLLLAFVLGKRGVMMRLAPQSDALSFVLAVACRLIPLVLRL